MIRRWVHRFLEAMSAPLALAVLALAVLAPAQAQTREVGGVKLDPEVTLRGSRLQLNGAGVRYKAVFKVYAAGLYTSRRVSTPDELYAVTGARRLHAVMLREIDARELGKLLTRGIEDNASRDEFLRHAPSIVRLGSIFFEKKKLAAGESFSLDYLPGTGTVILTNGVANGEPFKDPEFFNLLMKIWFGKSPADFHLKDALLGQQPA